MQYRHISKEKRRIIEKLTQAGSSNKKIAEELVRSASTIGRELKRNFGYSTRCYDQRQAQKLAAKCRKELKRLKISEKTWEKVFELSKLDFNI